MKARVPAWVAFVVGLGGMLMGGMVGCVVGGSLGMTAAQPGSLSWDSDKKLSRNEFRKKVLHRTREQVIDAVGRPSSTQSMDDREFWYYSFTTYDSTTGNTDWSVQVCFYGNSVTDINWY